MLQDDTTREYRLATWLVEKEGKNKPVRLFGIVKCYRQGTVYTGFAPLRTFEDFLVSRQRKSLLTQFHMLNQALEKPILDLDHFPNEYYPRAWFTKLKE